MVAKVINWYKKYQDLMEEDPEIILNDTKFKLTVNCITDEPCLVITHLSTHKALGSKEIQMLRDFLSFHLTEEEDYEKDFFAV